MEESRNRFKKVLVIDDSQVDRFVANKLLTKSGFAEEVISFESAVDALCYLRPISNIEHVPQLIFLDIRMPEMTGFEFLDLFTGLPKVIIDNCRVVVVSSSYDKNDRKKADENPHVCCFVDKPLHPDKIESVRACGRSKILNATS